MAKSIRISTDGRILEVYPWSKAELKENKLYHPTLVKTLRDCPEPVQENWYWHGHRAYRYAPTSFMISGKRLNKRMAKAKPQATFALKLDDKKKYDAAEIWLREAIANAGHDPDVILKKENPIERVSGIFGG